MTSHFRDADRPSAQAGTNPRGLGRTATALGGALMVLLALGASAFLIDRGRVGQDLTLAVAPGARVMDPRTDPLVALDVQLAPAHELSRIHAVVLAPGQWPPEADDPRPLPLSPRADGSVHLDARGWVPGVHTVIAEIERMGGRRARVHETFVMGPFSRREDLAERCTARAVVSERALAGAMQAVANRELPSRVSGVDQLGPKTIVESLDLSLESGEVVVSLALRGRDRIAVDARFRVGPSGPRSLHVELESLDRVEYAGVDRNRAELVGLWVGGALSGGAREGRQLGKRLVSDWVDHKATDAVKQALDASLAAVEELEVLPRSLALIEGEPRSTVTLEFCQAPIIDHGALAFGVRAIPQWPDVNMGPLPGPVDHGVRLGPATLAEGDDVIVDVSIDLINALLWSWTESRLLADRLAATGWTHAVNAELAEWTTLRVEGIDAGLAPMVTADGAVADGWRVQWPGLHLRVAGRDAARLGWIRVTAVGRAMPRWDATSGRLVLAGAADWLEIACERADGDRARIEPCFGDLLEMSDAVYRIDRRVANGRDDLPGIALGSLLRRWLTDEAALEHVRIEHPQAELGVLRLAATLSLRASERDAASPSGMRARFPGVEGPAGLFSPRR